MEKLGFHRKWIGLIIYCITTVSYSVLINGATHGCITPSRSLRQCDPFSPYLFLLCAEGFSSIINEAARNNELNGICISRGCPNVTHLLFADDDILFCEASSQECHKLTKLLSKYKVASRVLTKNQHGEIIHFL